MNIDNSYGISIDYLVSVFPFFLPVGSKSSIDLLINNKVLKILDSISIKYKYDRNYLINAVLIFWIFTVRESYQKNYDLCSSSLNVSDEDNLKIKLINNIRKDLLIPCRNHKVTFLEHSCMLALIHCDSLHVDNNDYIDTEVLVPNFSKEFGCLNDISESLIILISKFKDSSENLYYLYLQDKQEVVCLDRKWAVNYIKKDK